MAFSEIISFLKENVGQLEYQIYGNSYRASAYLKAAPPFLAEHSYLRKRCHFLEHYKNHTDAH